MKMYKIDNNSIGKRACILTNLDYAPFTKRAGEVKAELQIDITAGYNNGGLVIDMTETVAHDSGTIRSKEIMGTLSREQAKCLLAYLSEFKF